jgi:TolA-binding protein
MSFEELGRDVADALGDGPSAERRAAQRDAVVKHALARTESGRKHGWLWPALASTAAAAIAIVLWTRGDAPPEATPAVPEILWYQGAWLQAPANEPLVFQARDGSSVELAAASTGRIGSNSSTDVRLVLESGTLRAEVEPGGARWIVEAGPFQVLVLSTIFTTGWTPETGELQVMVERGSVRVSGGHLDPAGMTVREGDRLEVTTEPAQLVLTRADGEATTAAEPAEVPAAPEAEAVPAGPSRAGRRARGRGDQPGWKALAGAGEYRSALDAAKREGFDTLIGRLSLADLDLLATSARLAADGKHAHKALVALRQRFSSTEKGRIATFLLGRVAMELRRRPQQAAKWFRTYLDENPKGPLAEEARGRLVQALDRAGDRAGARAAAKAYLEHHPKGPYAKLARSLIGG